MVRANALFIVIVISLLVGMFCSSLIAIVYYQRMQVQQNQLIKRMECNAVSGINILLRNESGEYSEKIVALDLFDEGRDSVLLMRKTWGIFELAVVKAFAKNQQKTKAILIGNGVDDKGKCAIYIPDGNQQLAIGGKTVVKGTCYLPKQGVKRAYIEGEVFSGNTLINGEIRTSDRSLPSLNKRIMDPIVTVLEKGLDNDRALSLEKDTIINSFIDAPVVVTVMGELREKLYEGNVVIYSPKPLVIDSSARLNNVVVVAPSIKVKKHFSGRAQLFCSDSIIVEEHCKLIYPSVIGVIKSDFEPMQPFILIGEKSIVKGIVFTYCNVLDLQKTYIRLEKESLIEGQVYADGFVDSKGSIWGNVTCDKFVLRTLSGTYDNHLFKTEIDPSKRSIYFAGSGLIYSDNRKKIVQWLE